MAATEEFYIHPQTGEKILIGAAVDTAPQANQKAAVKAALAAKVAEIEAAAKEEELRLEEEAAKLLGEPTPADGAAPSALNEEVTKIENAIEGVFEKVKGAFGSKTPAAQ